VAAEDRLLSLPKTPVVVVGIVAAVVGAAETGVSFISILVVSTVSIFVVASSFSASAN
jgi:hypothetical protein